MLMKRQGDKQEFSIQECKNEIRAFLKKYIKEQELKDDQNFFASGLLNSMFAMQLVMFIEKTYEFKIVNKDLNIKNFLSLNAIAGFVGSKINDI